MDHERVRRHRVARHHGGFASRLLAAAARRCARPRSAPRRTWPRRPPPPHLPVDDGGDDAQLAGPQRSGGAPARHGTQRRQRRGDGQGRTVNQMPTGGGRYLKCRPPLGPCQPWDRDRAVHITRGLPSQGCDRPHRHRSPRLAARGS